MSVLFNNVRAFMGGTFFPRQQVLVDKGKIGSVGSRILKKTDTVIECEQRYLMPGLIDAHTHLGLTEPSLPLEKYSEEEPDIAPHLRPLDGIKMRDRSLEDARRAGVTTCMVCPGPRLPLSGVCSILKTNGNSADVGLIIEQSGILFSFGELPKFNSSTKNKGYSTRMGVVSIMRETLMKAQDYVIARQSKKKIKDREIDMEALLPLLRKESSMRACAHKVDDILAAIRIAEEFDLRLVIEHGTEAHLIADVLAEKKIPVVLGPSLLPTFRHELNEKSFESALILMDAGVEVALTCDYPGLPIETLRVAAAMAVQYGLDEKRALNSITTNPAKILGIDDNVGMIKKGYDADLALFSGHPLDIRSKLELLAVDGDLFVFSDDIQIESSNY